MILCQIIFILSHALSVFGRAMAKPDELGMGVIVPVDGLSLITPGTIPLGNMVQFIPAGYLFPAVPAPVAAGAGANPAALAAAAAYPGGLAMNLQRGAPVLGTLQSITMPDAFSQYAAIQHNPGAIFNMLSSITNSLDMFFSGLANGLFGTNGGNISGFALAF